MSTSKPAALLITPAFFGYESEIIAELERQGFNSTLLDERPSNGALVRAIARVRKGLIKRRIDSYYRGKIDALADSKFDLVIVIKAEVVPRWFLTKLRELSPSAHFVFYTFDAIRNASNCLAVLDCFDRLLSFDPADVAEHTDFSYLPLFYTQDFSPLPAASPRAFDLSFVGTLHSERYAYVKTLFAGHGRTFEFFFVQAKWFFAIVKYVTRAHRTVPWGDVSFTSMNRREIAEVFRCSHAVLDMQRTGQTGLTMRTFEVLASGAILVTSNQAIVEAPFYDPTRIVITPTEIQNLDSEKIKAELALMDSPDGAPSGFIDYSLANWVKALVSSRQADVKP